MMALFLRAPEQSHLLPRRRLADLARGSMRTGRGELGGDRRGG